MDSFQRKSSLLPGLLFGLLGPLVSASAAAQSSYPERPVRIIVGSPPGSTQDTVARLLAQKFSETFARPVVAENLAGAAGAIGVDRVAKAAPDGYTLGLLAQGQLTVNPGLYKVSYDTLRDFAPVSEASASHLPAELFKSMAGVNILHVPYKGVSAAIPDLVGGGVTMSFIPTSPVLALVREGKLRALAVTSMTRLQSMPDLPTVAESGYPGYEFTAWQGLLAPANTPSEIIGRLHLETVKALALPEIRAKFAALGMEAVGNSPAEFAAVIKSDLAKWARVIKEAGIKAD